MIARSSICFLMHHSCPGLLWDRVPVSWSTSSLATSYTFSNCFFAVFLHSRAFWAISLSIFEISLRLSNISLLLQILLSLALNTSKASRHFWTCLFSWQAVTVFFPRFRLFKHESTSFWSFTWSDIGLHCTYFLCLHFARKGAIIWSVFGCVACQNVNGPFYYPFQINFKNLCSSSLRFLNLIYAIR